MDPQSQSPSEPAGRVRTIGQVTVFAMPDRLLDEALIWEWLTFISAAATPYCRIILDFRELRHASSAATGMLIDVNHRVRAARGQLRLCNLQPQILAVFIITKLNKLFRVLNDVETALASMVAVNGLVASCPVAGCGGVVRPVPSNLVGPPGHDCPECGGRFVFGPVQNPADDGTIAAPVADLRLPTYDGEYVRVVPGQPYRLEVIGRLDLFASAAMEQAWAAVPAPRRVVVDLFGATEVTDAGLRALAAACGPEDRVAVVAGPSGLPAGGPLPAAVVACPSVVAAAAALGDIPGPSHRPLQVTVRPTT